MLFWFLLVAAVAGYFIVAWVKQPRRREHLIFRGWVVVCFGVTALGFLWIFFNIPLGWRIAVGVLWVFLMLVTCVAGLFFCAWLVHGLKDTGVLPLSEEEGRYV